MTTSTHPIPEDHFARYDDGRVVVEPCQCEPGTCSWAAKAPRLAPLMADLLQKQASRQNENP